MTRVRVVGDRVERAGGSWTPTVHRLLNHLLERGIDFVPRPLAWADGNESLTFVAGTAGNYPLSDEIRSVSALKSAARLLRRLHDASADFVVLPTDHWMLKARPSDDGVICHGDFAPYNCTFSGDVAVGVFDFDTAHPAPRTWDIAYALYRFAPLFSPDDADALSFDEQCDRARLFCDEYGLGMDDRADLPHLVAVRLHALVEFMTTRARDGDATFADNIAAGHDNLYRRDADYVRSIADELSLRLSN